jgi:hypothetical protein
MRLVRTTLAVAFILGLATKALGESIQGSYVEARSVAPAPKGEASPGNCQPSHVVLAWQVREGNFDGEKLDGQIIVAFVRADPSAGGGIGQTKTVFVVDSRTTASQERALVRLAKDLAPAAIHDAGEVVRSKPDVRIAEGCGCGAAVVKCHLASFRTRRMTDADVPLAGGNTPQKPLGEVFSCTEAVPTECAFEGGSGASGANPVVAFTGSFSR